MIRGHEIPGLGFGYRHPRTTDAAETVIGMWEETAIPQGQPEQG